MIVNTPKVSVIVPTYNVEKYARQCFDSLLEQTLENIEIILVDDGSSDSSGKICDEYQKKDKRIIVIHQTNRGLGLSRNSGLEVAKGDYIGFVDSDDIVSRNMFEILYTNAIKNNADISYCSFKRFFDDKKICKSEIKNDEEIKIWKGKGAIHQYLLDRIGLPPHEKNDCLQGASVWRGIFRKNILNDRKTRFISERQFIAEDMIFDIDVIPKCNCIVSCDLPLYFYRVNPVSLTTVYKPYRFEKNVELYHEMMRRLEKNYSFNELFDPMSRYLLTTARIAIIQEVKFSYINGYKTAKKRIRDICECKEIENVLTSYKYMKLPFKYRITCFFERYKCIRLLYLLYSIKLKKELKNYL